MARLSSRLLTVCAVLALCGTAAMAAQNAVPDFHRSNTGWRLLGGEYGGKNFMPPPPGSPGAAGPIGWHPDYPHTCNTCGGTPNVRIGNDTSPLLLPWAAAQMKTLREEIVAGKIPFDPAARCWLPGVPSIISFPIEPFYFLQTATEVIMVYQRGQLARHVYLNRPHSANLKPSWHGESVGHYEGETFVIDTIGLNDKTFVDVFNVPHTEQLHVIERYRIFPDGRLQVVMTVEDPSTFTQTWSAQKMHGGSPDPIEETICQEGVLADKTGLNERQIPVPTDDTPDF